jgi:hypothetical protein
MAHELSTPLGTIAVVARELERFASTLNDGSDLREDAKLIRSEVERHNVSSTKMAPRTFCAMRSGIRYLR